MKYLSSFLFVAAFAGEASSAEPAKPVATCQVKLNGHTFTLPAGFTIELAAASPLVDRPIVCDLDEQGRLYVADSSGSNEPAKEQLLKKPHRIVRLEDTTGSGKFDKSTVFADGMMFPEGAMWHAGSLYVAAVPVIWKLTDTTGNGVADKREVWYDGKTLTGCANDLHGPYLGPDGWIYWTKGAFAEQTYKTADGTEVKSKAARIFRARRDGTGMEPVITGGMDNPVEVAFSRTGEMFFTTTFLQHPAGGRRDGIIHGIYGGLYGKDHSAIDGEIRTGPDLMPVMTHLGAAAPSGLLRYESAAFGADYRDNLFAALFNMHKVTRHTLNLDGSTFKTKDEDFLVSDNFDFHPTDVIEDADGSLLVIDTGGWYKLCCPTSQLPKPDVLGAIYRVRRTDAPKVEDPRGLKLDWKGASSQELGKRLADPRPAVQKRAIQALADRGEEALPVLESLIRNGAPGVQINAIWAATRIDGVQARKIVGNLPMGADSAVIQTALRSISLQRDRTRSATVSAYLADPSALTSRVAAEAMGRMGGEEATTNMLAALNGPQDRSQEHAFIYPLIEGKDSPGLRNGLKDANDRARRAILIALDQMNKADDPLRFADVAMHLNAGEPRLKETAWWIASRHPEWGGDLAEQFRKRLDAKSINSQEETELIEQLGKLSSSEAIRQVLADSAKNASLIREARSIALRTMAQTASKEIPGEWMKSIEGIIANAGDVHKMEAARTLKAWRLPAGKAGTLGRELRKAAEGTLMPTPDRLAFLSAIPGGLGKVEPPVFDLIFDALKTENPPALRSLALDCLGGAKLDTGQLKRLVELVATVGPMEIERILDCFASCSDGEVGEKLLEALAKSPVRSSLRVDMLKPRLAKFGPALTPRADALYASLDADLINRQRQLEHLLTELKDGDIRRGQLVFNGAKAACSGCHAVGYLGGKVGPDLTGIGKIRTERDLLESIVFPSASFVRSYEPVRVQTKTGQTYNGLLSGEDGTAVVLTLTVDQKVTIAREDIEEMAPGKVSIMPAGLDQQLSKADLADLLAFLKSRK